MATPDERVEALVGEARRGRTVIDTPEGVPLGMPVANHGERLAAFALDITFMTAAIICLYLLIVPLFFSGVNIRVGMTVILFLAFIVRNMYFLHFEMAWQGRTPGKRICGLRVVNRRGGALTPSAIFARNLTREVEVFLPLSLFFGMSAARESWQALAILVWSLALTSLPFFNKGHLRAGDLIGGTQVIFMPKRSLTRDLSLDAKGAGGGGYSFTEKQLSIYGAFELQVLEELLRRPRPKGEGQSLAGLAQICGRICRKIEWRDPVPPEDARTFLTEFYSALRTELERKQLFGHYRADKTGAPPGPD
ncbi:MAG: RDD family protein [Synergistaceae bacterium]|jgi:uncharacterized RDD family membrane protein YckC|nr:RDD family protein [Synergistaceae bacterium]